ncbi:MAG: DUF4345 family protein [Pseudomonadota bacterium]
MISRVFLALMALVFIPYGLYCLVQPATLSGAAGLTATSLTGTIELQAMYGGLQTAVGVMCVLGVFRPRVAEAAMLALLFIFAGLAVVRVSLGLSQSDFSGYTVFAMSFETLSLLFLCWYVLLRGQPEAD